MKCLLVAGFEEGRREVNRIATTVAYVDILNGLLANEGNEAGYY